MENITKGHWIFAAIFAFSFVCYLIWSYRKELKLNIIGLMCIPPIDGDAKIYFKKMLELKKKYSFDELSMGMSSDYLDAIKNSATYVRIGSNIFGQRS